MNNPIFLKAIPRCGGTLFVTILDAHPAIAMSYEIYENNLFSDANEPLEVENIIRFIEESNVSGKLDDVKWIKRLPDNNLRVFLFRARRGGLNVLEILSELKCFAETNGSLENQSGRLDFIDALMKRKMVKEEKKIWGGKTQSDLYTLHQRYPNASFFIMNRDIRDVYASMCNTGNFNYTPDEAADLWKTRILEFRKFVEQCKPNAMEVCYEELATNPEQVLTKACEIVGIEYHDDMLHFHEKKMSLFQNPHGHLSSEKIKIGLNSQSIGRWKNDLKSKDVEKILSIVGELIVR